MERSSENDVLQSKAEFLRSKSVSFNEVKKIYPAFFSDDLFKN